MIVLSWAVKIVSAVVLKWSLDPAQMTPWVIWFQLWLNFFALPEPQFPQIPKEVGFRGLLVSESRYLRISASLNWEGLD